MHFSALGLVAHVVGVRAITLIPEASYASNTQEQTGTQRQDST